MFNSNLRFPFPSFFFLDRYRIFLNLTFLVESVHSFFFLDRYRFFLVAFFVESVFSFFLLSSFLFSFINSHLCLDKEIKKKYPNLDLQAQSLVNPCYMFSLFSPHFLIPPSPPPSTCKKTEERRTQIVLTSKMKRSLDIIFNSKKNPMLTEETFRLGKTTHIL